MSQYGIVNVRMVITQEKILANIDKVQKMINPNSKKQIIQLEDDTYFKDLIESIRLYFTEYPKKKDFPPEVYKVAYDLVEYATGLFEENTKQIEKLIRQREANINLADFVRTTFEAAQHKDEDWKDKVKLLSNSISEEIVDSLNIIGRCRTKKSANYLNAEKLVEARVANLESNLHIEIDMERIEDKSKALSYIGIEVAESLKCVPVPAAIGASIGDTIEANDEYLAETRFEVKPSLWQRIKQSKLARAIAYITKIRVVIDSTNTLPEGRGEDSYR